MKRLALICAVLIASAARAADVDDAIAAVKDAQSAAGGDACKSLATKLKLAVEAVEDAKKSPARIGPAKGRVEAAKEAAATACNDAAKTKVNDALATALAALEKAAAPKKVEHSGAPFQASCKVNDECQSEHCFVGANPPGYCSKLCNAVSDCPEHWQCRRPGSAPEKICIK